MNTTSKIQIKVQKIIVSIRRWTIAFVLLISPLISLSQSTWDCYSNLFYANEINAIYDLGDSITALGRLAYPTYISSSHFNVAYPPGSNYPQMNFVRGEDFKVWDLVRLNDTAFLAMEKYNYFTNYYDYGTAVDGNFDHTNNIAYSFNQPVPFTVISEGFAVEASSRDAFAVYNFIDSSSSSIIHPPQVFRYDRVNQTTQQIALNMPANRQPTAVFTSHDGGMVLVGNHYRWFYNSGTFSFEIQPDSAAFFHRHKTGAPGLDKKYLPGRTSRVAAGCATVDGNYWLILDHLEQSNPANDQQLHILKVNAQGDSIMLSPGIVDSVEVRHAISLPDSGAIIVGSKWNFSANQRSPWVIRLDKDFNIQWETEFPQFDNTFPGLFQKIQVTNGGFYVMGMKDGHEYLAKMDASGAFSSNVLRGELYADLNDDCMRQPSEPVLSNAWVRASPGNYLSMTDANGRYTFNIQPGNYDLDVLPYSEFCGGNATSVPVTIPNGFNLTTQDLALIDTVDCPYATVNVSLFNVRPCMSTTGFVQIRNPNFGPLTNTSVTLVLPPELSMVSAGLPYTSLPGNVYQFNTGTLPGITGGSPFVSFNFHAMASCSLQVGETVCVNAFASPDTLCDTTNWNGALLRVNGACDNDTIEFFIENIGTAPLSDPSGILVAEDDILSMSFSTGLVTTGDTILRIPGNGSTWTLIAEQEPTSPYQGIVRSQVEGCATNGQGGFSTGHVLTTLQTNTDPFHDIFCQVVTGSYDPNDKRGVPLGTGPDFKIAPGDPLAYTIRFQNTGNDTAFKVIILDQIPPELDLNTLQIGLASHPFQVSVESNNTLKWTFDPIFLPDSATNPTGSQGYVNFKIDQVSGLVPGNTIKNAAEIYFDFNAPIVTDTSLHTLAVNHTGLLTVVVDPPQAMEAGVIAYPNPTQSEVRFRPASGLYAELTVRIFDLEGRLVMVRRSPKVEELVLNISELPVGMYIFRMEGDGQTLGQGRLIRSN